MQELLNSGNSPEVSGHLLFYARQIPIPQEASVFLRFCLMSPGSLLGEKPGPSLGPIPGSIAPETRWGWGIESFSLERTLLDLTGGWDTVTLGKEGLSADGYNC